MTYNGLTIFRKKKKKVKMSEVVGLTESQIQTLAVEHRNKIVKVDLNYEHLPCLFIYTFDIHNLNKPTLSERKVECY